MGSANQYRILRLTKDEQQRALTAVESARRLQAELRDKYGKMEPESWELLNESRNERTEQLMRAAEE
jgi:hypothetical protein